VLVLIGLERRHVHLATVTTSPARASVAQQARNPRWRDDRPRLPIGDATKTRNAGIDQAVRAP
jgi:hypothetical protein